MSISPANISCIILAGGKGKRFDNLDKGLVEHQGRPFIEYVIDRITPQVDDIVISANRHHASYKAWSSCVISDQSAEYHGPLAGIASALPHCRHDWVLVVPCDMLFLPDDLVMQLRLNIGSSNISVARSDNRLQLVLLMHRSVLGSIQRSLELEHYKMLGWLETQNYQSTEFSDSKAFSNINSQTDLVKLL